MNSEIKKKMKNLKKKMQNKKLKIKRFSKTENQKSEKSEGLLEDKEISHLSRSFLSKVLAKNATKNAQEAIRPSFTLV